MDSSRRRSPARVSPLHTVLRRRGFERLLAASKDSPKALALYLLAARAGLGARECAGLDVGDVSADGEKARTGALVRTVDRRHRRRNEAREVAIDADTRGAIETYLAWRKGRCQHFRLRLRTIADRDGVERCHACREAVNFLKSPLFLGRFGRRVGAHWIREEFRTLGRRLQLPTDVRFASLGRRRWAERPASDIGSRVEVAVGHTGVNVAGVGDQGNPEPHDHQPVDVATRSRDRS
jgi:hypothetical protein